MLKIHGIINWKRMVNIDVCETENEGMLDLFIIFDT